MQVASNLRPNNPDNSFWSHTASLLAAHAATYSGSAGLSATHDYFLLLHKTILEPRPTQYPEVLFRSGILSAQSKSEYPYNPISWLDLYHRQWSRVPLRYLKTCFVATKWTCLGCSKCWLRVFTTKHISGLVFINYINEPTIYSYKVESTIFEVVSCNNLRFDTIGVIMAL